jgi:toxin FitB
VYLIDTNVISEVRKGARANRGVRGFFSRLRRERVPVFLSVVTVGELRRGVNLVRYRGDEDQARRLESWLAGVLDGYGDHILAIDADIAQVWGRLRVPHPANALDKLIAATALVYDLTVVTRNSRHFTDSGVRILDPFDPGASG